MRLDEQEITGPSDNLSFSAKQKAYYSKRNLNQLLDEVHSQQPSTYNRVPVQDRPPNLALPFETPTPLDLFSIFFPPHLLDQIAGFTNKKAENWWKDPTKEKSEYTRQWEDTDAAEIGAWLAIRLLMGLDHSPKYVDYWNTKDTKPIYILIQSAMTLVRFEQIRRFLKASDPDEPADIGTGQDYWKKVLPVVQCFRDGARQYYSPGSHISIDEFLIKFKGRSKHTMNISAKAGGIGFKLYGISNGDYLIDFLFTSKISKVSELKTSRQLGLAGRKLSDSNRVVIQLIKALPGPLAYRYHLFTDNFFTTTSCMDALRTLYVAHSGTCKAQSGYPTVLLAIREKARKKHDWGKQASMCIDDKILCLAWVDNNTVQFMTTGYSPEEVKKIWWLNPMKRHQIPPTSWQQIPDADKLRSDGEPDLRIQWTAALPVPRIIHEYNCNMNGIDRIAQMITVYQDYRRNQRYWIALFEFLLMASVTNAYHMYNINFCHEKFRQMTHLEFQRSVANALIEHCHSHRRNGPYSQLVNQDPPKLKHHWQKLKKPSYCRPCLTRQAPRPANKRTALGEISGNVPKKQRTRVSQPIWGCSACGVPCCRRDSTCWQQLHMLPGGE